MQFWAPECLRSWSAATARRRGRTSRSGKGEWFDRGRGAGLVFEPDGGLALERHLAREPQQRGDGVEEAACGGGGKAAHARAHQLARPAVAAGEVERRGSEVRQVVEVMQNAGGGLHPLPFPGGRRRTSAPSRPARPEKNAVGWVCPFLKEPACRAHVYTCTVISPTRKGGGAWLIAPVSKTGVPLWGTGGSNPSPSAAPELTASLR